MISISDDLKNALKEQKNYIKITFEDNGTSYTLTNADLIQNTFYLSRYCHPNGYIEIGTAVSAEIGFELFNDGTWDNVTFCGNEMKVEVGAVVGGSTTYMTLGYFTPSEAVRDDSAISIVAYDRLIQFNASASDMTITQGETLKAILDDIVARVGITSGVSATFTNYDYTVLALDTTYLTYGNILKWIAQLAGANAYVDENGSLQFGYFGNTYTAIDNSVRMQGTGTSDDAITITGIVLTQIATDSDGRQITSKYLAGDEGYCIDIYDNGLAQVGSMQTLVNSIWTALGGASFSYMAYECSVLPMPWLMPMDAINYTRRKDSNAVATILTDLRYELNSAMEVCCRAESATDYNNSSGSRNQANALSNIQNVGAYVELDTYNDEVKAHFTFSNTGLKITGTAGSSTDDYVNLSATEQTFVADGAERMKLDNKGLETTGRVKADEGLVIGNYKIAVINGQLCDVEA